MARAPLKALIVGAGIGGLATALSCHRQGMECEIYEQSGAVRELGVGINILPHAVRELRDLGLLERLDRVGVRTYELFYFNRRGQEVWHELRGMDAGHDVPQFSIHRGHLQGILYNAVTERLGEDAVRTDRRLVRFEEGAGRVSAVFADRSGREVERSEGDLLIGADGIRSTVRAALNPGEGDPIWNGAVLWRGTRDWPAFLTGRSMLIAGGLQAKVVVYPIGPGETPATRLTNWAVIGVPERRADRWLGDWSRPGSWDELRPFVEPFRIGEVDVLAMTGGSPVFYEYPLCDRDPLPGWSAGRVTLLGDAAHPMYPVGSNGASQAIIDARCLADRVAELGPQAGLAAYEGERRPATAAIVRSNRSGGPEGVIDAVEALAPDGFDDIEAVLPRAEREAIVRGYASASGFATPAPMDVSPKGEETR
ncbi:MAG: flavin-dependent oxidoreductase [Candidatus Dormibacteraeota bacterium]|nr:flavin-dependent oxidoreductase [Candidatus Dormibacteraeota bacterium]